jgi:hypothetical protein
VRPTGQTAEKSKQEHDYQDHQQQMSFPFQRRIFAVLLSRFADFTAGNASIE